MKDIIAQVDSFVDALFEGSVITLFYDSAAIKIFEEYMDKETFDKGQNILRDLVKEQIPQYRNSSGSAKQELAETIFDSVLLLRANRFIYNNPNSAKELEFYRIKNGTLKEEVNELKKKNSEYVQAIMALKAGSSGIS